MNNQPFYGNEVWYTAGSEYASPHGGRLCKGLIAVAHGKGFMVTLWTLGNEEGERTSREMNSSVFQRKLPVAPADGCLSRAVIRN